MIGALLGVLLWTSGPPARAERYTFRAWTANDGLSQSSVRALAQDGDGFVWIGTQAGLNRFDGVSFRSYTVADGLPSDHVNDLLWDGALWVATNDGIARLDGDRFRPTQLPKGLGAWMVSALAPRAEGGLWCGTNAGLLSFDGTSFAPGPWPELAGVRLRALASDGRRLAVASERGLFLADDLGAGWIAGGAEPLSGVDIDQDGTIWAVGEAGLVEIVGRTIVRRWASAERLPTDVWTVTAAGDGTLWLTSQSGIAWLRDGEIHRIGRDEGLPIGGASVALEDADGLMWFGGYGGLGQLASLAFSTFTQADGLGADSVRPILRDRDGVLWVGTVGGLSALSPAGWRNYTRADGLPADTILALGEAPNGTLWVAARGGLAVREGGRFRVRLPASIGRIVFEPGGRIWAIEEGHGPWVSEDGRTFSRVAVPGQVWSGSSRAVVDRSGVLWVTGARGLSRFDGSWRTYTHQDGLAGDDLYFIAEDRAGILWLGYDTSRGLTRFDGEVFRTFTAADGLHADSVYSIGGDRRGNLWVGTARGVDRFDGAMFRNYGPGEGYASQESNSHGFWEDADGILWFGTLEGLSRYDPALDHPLPGPPRLALEAVTVGGRPPGLGLRWDENELQARVGVRSYTPPARSQIEYRVTGFSDAWAAVDGPIHLTNLAPGPYTLEVRGRRYGGEWSAPVTASWSIRQPFWRAPWFVAAAGLLVVGGLWAGVRVRVQAAERANAVLRALVAETQRAEAAAREANEAKSVFLATMSHELRTPLNAIIGYAEMLADDLTDPAAKEDVERIRGSAGHLLRILSDVLDLARVEVGQLEVERRAFAVAPVVQEAAETVRGVVGADRFDVDVQCPDAEVVGDPDRLRQVLLNLLTNGFKFTDDGRVRLTVRRRPDDERIWFEIADEGIGIAPDHIARLFQPFVQLDGSSTRRVGGVGLGLAICKELVHRMGGDIEVVSRPGAGSTFSVWLMPQAGAR